LTDHQNEDRRQPQDDSADPRLRDLIYRAGTVIRLRAQDSDWVWDVFIRAQDGDETRLSGLPIEFGELYPLLVMEESRSRRIAVPRCLYVRPSMRGWSDHHH